FNIEAAEEKVYDEIMGTHGNFQFLKKSIMSVVKNKILVEGHFVPMKRNINQIEKTLEFCEKLGVSKMSFLRLVIHGRRVENKEKIGLSDIELRKVENSIFCGRKVEPWEGDFSVSRRKTVVCWHKECLKRERRK